MSERIEETKHDVSIEAFVYEDKHANATVQTYTYPDGSPTNNLGPDELREVAAMLNDVADRMEEYRDAE